MTLTSFQICCIVCISKIISWVDCLYNILEEGSCKVKSQLQKGVTQ